MPRSPEQDALRSAWATINSVIVNQSSITTFGNYLTQHGFLGQQVVHSILSVGAIDDTTKVARLMSAVQTKIEYAPSPSQKYKELVLLLHDDLELTDLAQIMVDACRECYKKKGLSYESPLKSQPEPGKKGLPNEPLNSQQAPEKKELPNESPLNTQQAPVNSRTEFNGTSSNQLRRRNGNKEQNDQEESDSDLPENGSTTSEKGTSRCCKVAFVAAVGSILIALYLSGYIPSHHSQENEIPPNLTSLSEEQKEDATPPTDSSEELKENAIPLNFISLSNELQDIEEWSDLCTYFGVKTFLKNRIEDEYKTVKDRREKCLSAYLDSGRASWQHVVNVISRFPFYKCTLGKDIARKYHVSLPECANDND